METDTYQILESWIKESKAFYQDESGLLEMLEEENEEFLFGFIFSLLI